DVDAVAAKARVLGDADVDVEVARAGAALTRLAFAAQLAVLAVLGAGRDHEREVARLVVARRDLDRLGRSERRFFERDLERVADVAAALLGLATAEQVVDQILRRRRR